MSILRSGGAGGIMRRKNPVADKTEGISVKCPKCQSAITFSGLRGDEPLRCGNCSYPMICRSDLLLLIDACKKVKTASQASSAVQVLRRLSEMMPEAGTALGLLPTLLPVSVPLNEQDRWNTLAGAYAAGDDNAREGLNLMRQSSPELYGTRHCKNCGAMKYFERNNGDRTVCPYCQSTD